MKQFLDPDKDGDGNRRSKKSSRPHHYQASKTALEVIERNGGNGKWNGNQNENVKHIVLDCQTSTIEVVT